MNREKIFNRQIETLECNKTVLNILPGEMLLADFMEEELCLEGSYYIPFNEAICEGEVTKEIFSKEFIKQRAKSLNVSEDVYISKTKDCLNSISEEDYDIVHLWFGLDMNCIMNLILVLAYFEQQKINKKFYITFIDDYTQEISGLLTEVTIKDWLKIYESAFFKGEVYNNQLPTMFVNGINNFLKFKSKKNELTKYILENDFLSKDAIVEHFLKYNKILGLSKDAYSRLVDRVRKNN